MLNKEYPSFYINKRKIGIDYPTYFIAEIGSNFDGDLNRAKDLIYLAKEYGAEAAKFQHYNAEGLVSDFGFKSLSGIKSHQSSWQSSVFDTYKKASLNKPDMNIGFRMKKHPWGENKSCNHPFSVMVSRRTYP